MLVALAALFVSLGGSASAIIVNGKAIKNGTVTGADLKNRSVRGRDVARNTLGSVNIKESALGTVPKARSASDALNAVAAKQSELALNSKKLGGLDVAALVALVKLDCPPATILHAGACIETARRPAESWRAAWRICAAADRRLAELGEVYSLRVRLPAQNVDDELTAEWHDFDQMNIVNDNGNANPELAVRIGVGSALGAYEFRCVAPLRN